MNHNDIKTVGDLVSVLSALPSDKPVFIGESQVCGSFSRITKVMDECHQPDGADGIGIFAEPIGDDWDYPEVKVPHLPIHWWREIAERFAIQSAPDLCNPEGTTRLILESFLKSGLYDGESPYLKDIVRDLAAVGITK